ncbi:hypothetical protein DFH27DRAFT_526154 [Peziza echinospora]|nr:hypothetical protein DFH27DRAFT_526154 [Peziza echinospora]
MDEHETIMDIDPKAIDEVAASSQAAAAAPAEGHETTAEDTATEAQAGSSHSADPDEMQTAPDQPADTQPANDESAPLPSAAESSEGAAAAADKAPPPPKKKKSPKKEDYTKEHLATISACLGDLDDFSNIWHGTHIIPAEEAKSSLKLFYKDSESNCRYIQLPPEDGDESIKNLVASCSPASFGRGNEDVLDPTYRNALRLDTDSFAINFSPEQAGIIKSIQKILGDDSGEIESQREVYSELYKLNVYGPGGFFKAHKDTPRAGNMFGSLVVCLPCVHEGGQLILREEVQGGNDIEHTCDWGSLGDFTSTTTTIVKKAGEDNQEVEEKIEKKMIKVPWVAFFSEIVHEIIPVTSGNRLTLTYNLYFQRPQAAQGEEVKTTPPRDPLANPFHTTLKNLLQNDATFLPSGGVLIATLANSYPIQNTLNTDRKRDKNINKLLAPYLKGRDRTLYMIADALGLSPRVKGELEGVQAFSPWEGYNSYFNILTATPYALCGFDQQNEQELTELLVDTYEGDFMLLPTSRATHRIIHDNLGRRLQKLTPEELKRIAKVGENRYGEEFGAMFMDEKRVVWLDGAAGGKMKGGNGVFPVDIRHPFLAYGNQASLEWVYGKGVLVINELKNIPVRLYAQQSLVSKAAARVGTLCTYLLEWGNFYCLLAHAQFHQWKEPTKDR